SLRRVAEILAGRRDDTRTFAVHPDVAHYGAWFSPRQKHFLDSRLQLFVPVADDYEYLCESLLGPLGLNRTEPDASAVGRTYQIGDAVVYDPEGRHLSLGLRQLTQSPVWSSLRVEGQAFIVGAWGGRFDAERLAFAPREQEQLGRAPDEGPSALTYPRAWWE